MRCGGDLIWQRYRVALGQRGGAVELMIAEAHLLGGLEVQIRGGSEVRRCGRAS